MYNPYVVQAANQYSIPVPIMQGLVSQESSWNPFASPGTTSAYGLTQLTTAAADQVGANPFDPISNIFGGAQYLASMPGNDWATKLAHYFQGPSATINSSGTNYASSVLSKAKDFITGGIAGLITGKSPSATQLVDGAACAASGGTDVAACATAVGSVLGGSGSTDWVTEIKNWILSTGFFQRIALAVVAFLLLLGAIYTLKGKSS
jgi:hypothetical protein